jgi:HlyD family secretion protein
VARLNSDQVRAKLDAARADLQQIRAQRLVTQAQIERAGSEILRAKATEADAMAQIARAEALSADAERILGRQVELQSRGYAAQATLDTARTQRDSQRAALAQAQAALAGSKAQQESLAADRRVAEAQLVAVTAQIAQREAVVRQIEVDLKNTEIRSPVDGVVIQRNIELGQTVAASLQAPTLFLIADDLRHMEISANVDEADVGRVLNGQRVSFTVNAYPGRTFEGRVKQVRLGSQTVQNVVIYTAIVSVENPRLELRPGMTANLRIETENRPDVLRVANAALRWRPPSAEAPVAPSATALPTNEPDPQRTPGAAQRATLEFVAALRNELGLSSEQREKLDAILAEQRRTAGARLGETDPAARRERFAGPARVPRASERDPDARAARQIPRDRRALRSGHARRPRRPGRPRLRTRRRRQAAAHPDPHRRHRRRHDRDSCRADRVRPRGHHRRRTQDGRDAAPIPPIRFLSGPAYAR